MQWLIQDQPALLLAPMEGMMDVAMRAMLTSFAPVHGCVAEFVRVTQQIPPTRVFHRVVPELLQGGFTPSGVPVQVQLLGGDDEALAAAALVALKAGAQAIDLNFGCPAPIVNRHDGGARLLQDPERLYRIVRTVRQTVPCHLPVSAKLRLGWQSATELLHNGTLACKAGASWLTIHGRTRSQGYKPPVDWQAIGQLARAIDIPVVANGDIFSVEDLKRCQQITGCQHFMLGRGAIFRPWLAQACLHREGQESLPEDGQDSLYHHRWPIYFADYTRLALQSGATPEQLLGRLKQWVALIGRHTHASWPKLLLRATSLQDWQEQVTRLWPQAAG